MIAKRRKIIIIAGTMVAVLGIAALLLAEPISKSVSRNAEDPFLSAYQASDANFRELTVQSWGKYDTAFHDSAALNDLYEKLLPAVGEGAELTKEEYGDGLYCGINAQGVTPEGYDITLVLQSIQDNYEEDETYLIITMTEDSDYQQAARIRQKADGILAALEVNGQTNVLLSAYYDGVMPQKEKSDTAKAIFRAADGEIAEGVEESAYISKSGFCPGMGRSVVANGQEINLQVALFDNELQEQTWLYIGTPLVFSEY